MKLTRILRFIYFTPVFLQIDPVGRLCLKDQIMIDRVEDPISLGVFKQQKQTSIRGEILGREFDSIDHIHIRRIQV